MKAILLAAGLGTRLGELTKDKPKCLLPVGDRPLLDYWLESLEKVGVTEALINTHYHADQVEAYVRKTKRSVHVATFYEPTLLGSAGTIRDVKSFIGDDENFFILYADNFSCVDLSRLKEYHIAKGCPVLTLVAYPTDEPRRCGILEIDNKGLVVSFEEKPENPKSNFANSGIHVANHTLFSCLPLETPADLGFHVLPRLTGKMFGYVTREFIQDIGTPDGYARANQFART